VISGTTRDFTFIWSLSGTGTSFGAPSPYENVLAKMVIDAVPSVEMVRFTNSGRCPMSLGGMPSLSQVNPHSMVWHC